MKTKAVPYVVILLICAGSTLLAEDDASAVWGRLYANAQTIEQKHDILLYIVELRNASTVPVLVNAMRDLITTDKNLRTARDRHLHNEATKFVARALGDFKVKEANQLLFEVVTLAQEPFLKAEAIHALGKIGAEEYGDDIAIMLRNINLNYDTGSPSRDGEAVAYACVLALELLKQPVAFRSLFFASIGWYSAESQVKERATEALNKIIEDPSTMLMEIIIDETEYSAKLQALVAEKRSTAGSVAKVDVAVEALRQGLIHEPKTVVQTTNLHRLRITALDMLSKYRTSNPEPAILLEEIILRNFPLDEKLAGIVALGVQNTDDATGVLVRYLKLQNDRQARAAVPDNYRIILTTIRVLDDTRNPAAFEELTRVLFSNWTPAVETEAEKALGKLE